MSEARAAQARIAQSFAESIEGWNAHLVPGKTPWVFLHGQPGSARAWSKIIARLPLESSYIALDRPGWGLNPLAAQGVIANAKTILSSLRRMGLTAVKIVGHSYGGAIAVAMASFEPGFVEGLVLVSPAANRLAVLPSDHLMALPLAGELLTRAGFRFYRRFYGQSSWGSQQAESFALEQAWMLHELDYVESMAATVLTPTVIIGAAGDRIIPFKSYQALAQTMPNARLTALGRGGHSLLESSPSDILVAMSFLADLA